MHPQVAPRTLAPGSSSPFTHSYHHRSHTTRFAARCLVYRTHCTHCASFRPSICNHNTPSLRKERVWRPHRSLGRRGVRGRRLRHPHLRSPHHRPGRGYTTRLPRPPPFATSLTPRRTLCRCVLLISLISLLSPSYLLFLQLWTTQGHMKAVLTRGKRWDKVATVFHSPPRLSLSACACCRPLTARPLPRPASPIAFCPLNVFS